jgi:hypothetical protein
MKTIVRIVILVTESCSSIPYKGALSPVAAVVVNPAAAFAGSNF